MNRIRVKGNGELKVTPDTTVLKIDLEKVTPTYEETITSSAEDASEVRETLVKLGFKEKDIKTLHLNVSPAYESYRDENNDYKQKLIGYKYNQKLIIRFSNNNETLGKVLYELQRCSCKPVINLDFIISNIDKVKDKLLKLAVNDAKKTAETICNSSNVSLGDIINIEYFNSSDLSSGKVFDGDFLKCSSVANARYDINIVPDDLKLNESVVIEWDIIALK